MSKRVLSHSEISTAYDCQAKHAYSYTGALTNGDALKAKRVHVNLREGRAWGAGIAAWHYTGDKSAAHAAMARSLAADAEELTAAGFYDAQEHHATKNKLAAILEHEIGMSGRLDMVAMEEHLRVAVRSEGGRRSPRYDFEGYLDGVVEEHGRVWIWEAKLRKQLSSLDQVARSPQLRRYAWAWRELHGVNPAGIILDERLNAAPSEVKLNANGSVSKVQSCTVDAYLAACLQAEQDPDEEVLAKLAAKRWGERHRVFLTELEIARAGRDLFSASRLIHQLETSRVRDRLAPVANPSPMRCPGCSYRDICGTEYDPELIDALYTRVLPKRFREREVAA